MNNINKIFNKSFNDLSFLLENTEKQKFIFVFDFDLTLTFISSDGIKIDSNYIDLFGNNNKLIKLKEIMNKIINNGYNMYINTRGVVSDIKHILTNVGLDIMIKEIKGSKNVDNINVPLSNQEITLYNLYNINNINIFWAVKKVIHLNQIKEQENISNNNILFFDDSILNINTAKLNGYNNSFLIGSNDSGLYGLDYLLIKLEQILELL